MSFIKNAFSRWCNRAGFGQPESDVVDSNVFKTSVYGDWQNAYDAGIAYGSDFVVENDDGASGSINLSASQHGIGVTIKGVGATRTVDTINYPSVIGKTFNLILTDLAVGTIQSTGGSSNTTTITETGSSSPIGITNVYLLGPDFSSVTLIGNIEATLLSVAGRDGGSGVSGAVGSSATGSPGDPGYDGNPPGPGSPGGDGGTGGDGSSGSPAYDGEDAVYYVSLGGLTIGELRCRGGLGGSGASGGGGGDASGGQGGTGGYGYNGYPGGDGGNGGNGGTGGNGGGGSSGGLPGEPVYGTGGGILLNDCAISTLIKTAWGGSGGGAGAAGQAYGGGAGAAGTGEGGDGASGMGGSPGTPGSDGGAGTDHSEYGDDPQSTVGGYIATGATTIDHEY